MDSNREFSYLEAGNPDRHEPKLRPTTTTKIAKCLGLKAEDELEVMYGV